MKLFVVGLFLGCALWGQDFQLGGVVPEISVTDPAGKAATFAPKGKVTVVAFISTKCPISNAYNDRMSALYREYSGRGVQFIFVNANANENAAEVAEHAKSAAFPFAVYKDMGNELADRFGAMATPETYIIDPGGVLRYHGYVDDSTNEARVKNRGLKNAIDAVLGGTDVPQRETKAFGCTIKRVRRTS